MFLLCRHMNPTSFENVRQWYPGMPKACARNCSPLRGREIDLRGDPGGALLQQKRRMPVNSRTARGSRALGAYKYIECLRAGALGRKGAFDDSDPLRARRREEAEEEEEEVRRRVIARGLWQAQPRWAPAVGRGPARPLRRPE